MARFLAIAAEDSQGFYGLLARAALGRDQPDDGAPEVQSVEALAALTDAAGARRALALDQIGRKDLAEQELRRLAGRADPKLKAGLMVLARKLDLPAVQMRLAQSLRYHGYAYHRALYPVPSWQPIDGFILDRALLYSVMRAESGFDPAAESHAGARGLMQLMPATAREVAARAEIELTGGDGLFEPVTGIALGEAYLDHILRLPGIDRNLLLGAIAYNAGPGRVKAWRKALQLDHDPLLFLESLPVMETRIYVKKVLTNLWNYRARLGQPRPSLKALAADAWPLYQAFDKASTLHARN